MSKKTRLVLLSIFVILFFLVAPQIILYSLGYRFDFERKKIVNIGGLYLKVWPPRAEIFIDGKFIKKTDFFFDSILIQNLLPKKYKILVEKEGYHPWQKTLEIKGKEVTKAENIILIKENLAFKNLEDNLSDFFFSPDGKNIILQKLKEKGAKIEIFPLEKENQKKIFSLSFKNIQEISLNPQNSQEIFFVKDNTLYLKNEKTLPILNNLISYEISGNNIIWLANSGFIYRSDLSGNTIEVLNIEPFSIKKDALYKIISKNGIIFLKENKTPSVNSKGSLFLLNSKSKIFEKFHEPVKDLKFFDNKILFFNDNEIWFSNLDSKKIEKTFLTRFSEKIEDCFWLNPYYLIFNTKDKIKILEIDNRDRINIVNLIEFSALSEPAEDEKNPKIFWNNNNKKLYILEGKTLFVSEKLIP